MEPLRPDQQRAATLTLAEAFATDALLELLAPDAGGTVVTLTDEIELDGILGLFEPLLGAMVRRQYRANLGRLKAIMETQVAAGS